MILSIVIVNYRVPLLLEQCLHSVSRAIAPIKDQVEVWVVDNASGDGSIDLCRKAYPFVHYIQNSENIGFARANNQAIRLCSGQYVLLLNPDTIIGESTLTDCISFMEQHPRVGGLGVRMMDACGRFLPESKRGFPSPAASFFKLTGLYALAPKSRMLGRYYMGWLSSEEPAEVEVLAGAFMLMRMQALEEVGLLDEQFFMYGEDIDLSHRLRLGGFACYYLPIPILHYKGESSALDDVRYLRAFYGAMQLFFDKYYKEALGPVGRAMISLAIHLRMLLARSLCYIKQRIVRTKQNAARERQKTDYLHILTSLEQKDTKGQRSIDPQILEGVIRSLSLLTEQNLLANTDRMTYDDLLTIMRALEHSRHTVHIQRGLSAPIISPRE